MAKPRKTLLGLLALCVTVSATAADPMIKRGRYLVVTGACNTCHTALYGMLGGDVPESDWLTGDKVGWRGIWGTTYATNLRLYMQASAHWKPGTEGGPYAGRFFVISQPARVAETHDGQLALVESEAGACFR